MNDFSPETRRSGWWATDSRKAVSGHLVGVILEKRGETERPDLSGVEAVQMGLKMQPVIGKLFEEATGIAVREYDLAGTHKSETWLKAHTDFTTGDGGLLEVKNYNGAYIKNFSGPDEVMQIPQSDYIQLVHEATVFGVPHIYLAVLFGGQSFRHYRLDVTEQIKDEFIQKAAQWWALCQNGEMPPAETTDEAKKIYRETTDDAVVSNAQVENVILALKEIKEQIKKLEKQEESATVLLQNYMQNKTAIITPYNETLVTWKANKASKSFDSKLFAQAMPDVYEKFIVDKPGARRFLVK